MSPPGSVAAAAQAWVPSEGLPDPRDVDARVRAEQVDSHYRLVWPPLLLGLSLSVLIAFAVLPSAGPQRTFWWLGFLWVTGCARLYQCWSHLRGPQRIELLRDARGSHIGWVLADGLSWGVQVPLFLPTGSPLLDTVLYAGCVGAASLTWVSSTGKLWVTWSYVTLVLWPSILHLLLVSQQPHATLGALCLFAYWAMMVWEVRRNYLGWHELIRLRMEHAIAAGRSREAQDAAERASAAKSRFLASVSHEMRTPLNGILGMAQMMQTTPLTPEQRDQAQVIAQSARDLRVVIDDVLEMARLESSRLTLRQEPFALRESVRWVSDALVGLARAKGLTLAVEVAPELSDWWRGDAGRIRQVLHNLLGNAIKFTHHGGIRLQVEPLPDGLRFRCIDTGIGIEPEALERIFLPFEQVDSAARPAAGGTGLGLAISREVARAMGGDVRCLTSTPQGSVFVFDVVAEPVAPPRVDDASADGAGARPGTEGAHGAGAAATRGGEGAPRAAPAERALLAEDNPVNATVLKAMLEHLGFEVHSAVNGAAALRALRAGSYAVVLMDGQMPELDGYEATRRWRAIEAVEPQRGRTPIVAVTGNDGEGDRLRCLQAGMDDFLAKPFELEALQQVLVRVRVVR